MLSAVVTSSSDSAAALAACLLCLAASSTTELSTSPTATNTPRASTLFGLRDGPFVQRRGEVEVQQQRACDGLEHRGTKPPTIATAMTAARKASTSVVRLSSCLRLARKRVSSGARTTARA